MISDIFRYRSFILSSISNDFRARFASSKVGLAWAILNPLVQVLIYSLILSNVLRAKLPGVEGEYSYAIYLMAGLLFWGGVSEVVSRLVPLFVNSADMLRKVKFPKITLPVITLGVCLINNGILALLVVGALPFMGGVVGINTLWLIPLILLTFLLSMSLGLFLSILNVFFREVGQIVPVVLQLLFWLTPIVYPIHIVPENFSNLLQMSPFVHLVAQYQQVLMYGSPPDFEILLILFLGGMLLTLITLFLFRRAAGEMVDVL